MCYGKASLGIQFLLTSPPPFIKEIKVWVKHVCCEVHVSMVIFALL